MNDRTRAGQRPNAGGAAALRLRPEQPGDADFLLQLFCETHRDILAGLDLPLVEMLLGQQHAGQTMTYRASYPAARFDIVLDDGVPVGRLVVDARPDMLHIVDIALLPAAQGCGRGTALIAGVMRRAAADGRGVSATVRDANAASRATFARLGFTFRSLGDATSEAAWPSRSPPACLLDVKPPDTLSNES